MEATICDISAFDYWRIPPVVQILIAGEEDDSTLQKMATDIDVPALRSSIVEQLPLCQAFFKKSPHTRSVSELTRTLAQVVPLLAANHEGPIDILLTKQSQRHSSIFLKPHLWQKQLPEGGIMSLFGDIGITSPAFTLLELAARANDIQTLMMASEICGSFAVYNPPSLIREALEKLLPTKQNPKRHIPIIGGWRPFVDSKGHLSSLWQRPPLVHPCDLALLAERSESRRGAARLKLTSELVKGSAASPFEVQTALLLGLPRRCGGQGLDGFVCNKRIDLTHRATLLAEKRHCYCDLFWEEGLDLECQSTLVHQNAESYLADSERALALESMGIKVLPITFDQISSRERFDAVSQLIAATLGLNLPKKTPRQQSQELELRRQVLIDWETVHLV